MITLLMLFVFCRAFGHARHTNWTSGEKWNIQNDYQVQMGDVNCSSGYWSSCTFKNNPDCGHDKMFILYILFLRFSADVSLIKSQRISGSFRRARVLCNVYLKAITNSDRADVVNVGLLRL